jgi:hypothetical protein
MVVEFKRFGLHRKRHRVFHYVKIVKDKNIGKWPLLRKSDEENRDPLSLL